MKKLIFLDIDGVLNSQLYAEKHHNKDNESDTSIKFPMSMIDPISVSFLNSLVENTGAEIIISSVWRFGRSIEELQNILEQRGFIGKVIGKTRRIEDAVRGDEIRKFIEDNKELIGYESSSEYKDYVIFDDDSDMLLWQQYNFIHVDGYAGLSPNNCYKAKFILNGKY